MKNTCGWSAGLMLVLAFSGISATTNAPTKADKKAGADHAVTMKDNLFDPKEIHIKVGEKVTWTNKGDNTHTATSDKGAITSFDSGDLASGGQTTQGPFNEPGTIKYHCTYHPRMIATIVVER